ncbi:response regulator [Sphingobacterium corticibacter]|uniref:Response regulator n=1 Tax=Sphingobacterium corticibacter TaxID=2171749 RepID=A0A2T8HIZ1_9SPHI|nr:response regulator [Sphingobacterium corticibacter]PVH25340.1 response regulator [Sphingobacterium corticibacter]
MNNKNKILIIDDDPRNIYALELTLRMKGYTSVSSASATEGIALLHSSDDIAVVLMDMMMPDLDGYQAIRMIRSTRGFESLPIIAVTAQAMVGDREKCLAAGADDYISKPVDLDKLLHVLSKII